MKLLYTAKTLACIPLYTVREGKNAIGIECWSGETTRAPAVQKGAFWRKQIGRKVASRLLQQRVPPDQQGVPAPLRLLAGSTGSVFFPLKNQSLPFWSCNAISNMTPFSVHIVDDRTTTYIPGASATTKATISGLILFKHNWISGKLELKSQTPPSPPPKKEEKKEERSITHLEPQYMNFFPESL